MVNLGVREDARVGQRTPVGLFVCCYLKAMQNGMNNPVCDSQLVFLPCSSPQTGSQKHAAHE